MIHGHIMIKGEADKLKKSDFPENLLCNLEFLFVMNRFSTNTFSPTFAI